MAATRRMFAYKCSKGHLTSATFPLGTRMDDFDERPCTECIKVDVLETAYLIYVDVTNGEPGQRP